jgi:very-short-patch-repair endonuclease
MTEETAHVESTPHGIEIALEYSDRINFAMQQQGSTLVEAVLITNSSQSVYEDGEVRIRLANGECEGWDRQLSRVAPGMTVRVVPEGWVISPEKLRTRTEAERTTIDVTFTADTLQVCKKFELDILAFDQWAGVGHYPEFTGAFVTPNHSLIAELLGDARKILGSRGESSSLDGYQSGSRQRAARIAEACYLALAARGIGYINPPASFERSGQRIRMVDRVLREELGTCLDLSLILMGMWEQCGLHTVLLLPEGHAVPAFWTHNTHLPETAIDEPARIRNLIELGELVAVESTLVTKDRHAFEDAANKGHEQMAEPGLTFCAIDLKSARKRGIRPLPLQDQIIENATRASTAEAKGEHVSSELDSVLLAERADRLVISRDEHEEAEVGGGRIQRWQNRLLDLSLRNRLLNFKQTGRTLPLCVPDLALLDDMLAGDERFDILPRSGEGDEFFRQELESKRLYSDSSAADTQKRLLTLYRLSRSGIEETGANLLHLALGHLVWFESDSAESPRIAPLILLPVKLIRISSGSGYSYKLTLTDEPIRPNITLLEKLRTEFGIDTEGLDELPEDENGIDVPLVLRNFRAVIRDSSRWEVVESANVGMFSFNKFLMWRDLRDNIERLKQNRLVRHLVDSPSEPFNSEPFPDPRTFDEELQPDDVYCTRDADSSQLTAVRAASMGRTFVLEGPPGTGKSQTIANIVADAVAHGKRVLFVAEKMAALSVVRKRLNQDGLGPYCLELHSTKGSKKEVLAQLGEALNAPDITMPRAWDATCAELGTKRERLNEYVRELHIARPSGESLYEMLGRLTGLGQQDRIDLHFDKVASISAEQLESKRALVDELCERSQPIDPVVKHPLRGIGLASWDFGASERARGLIESAQNAANSLSDQLVSMLKTLKPEWNADSLNRADLWLLGRLAVLIQGCPIPDAKLVDSPDSGSLREKLHAFIRTGRDRDALRSDLLGTYHEEFLSLEPLGYIDQIQRASVQILPFRWLRGKLIRRKFGMYAKSDVPKLLQLQTDLQRVRDLVKLEECLDEQSLIAEVLRQSSKDDLTNWDASKRVLDWCDLFAKALAESSEQGASLETIAWVVESVCDKSKADRVIAEAPAYRAAYADWCEAWESVCAALKVDIPDDSNFHSGYLNSVIVVFGGWLRGLDELSSWCGWRKARDAAVNAGLRQLVEGYESGNITRESLSDSFEHEYGVQWFNATANSIACVREFNADIHRTTVAQFCALDSEIIEQTKSVVASILVDSAPTAPTHASSRSEVGILRREMEKKRRHMPTRRLIASIPNLLPRLKPCFLMSPLSVAQFLDSDVPQFDLIVFDEASQIPVWDAIGAIARGQEVVVVGDSKQLPPTSFFNSLDGDEEFDAEDYMVDDMESILKECNACGIPALRLKWHYRSRHESLIAFSNQMYYQNELHTFPSPVKRSDRLGVSFHHVAEGVYDRGNTRTNRIEAERVVEEVVRMLQDHAETDSIGIVTFNQAQQTLIEDLLDEQRRLHPEIEEYFTDSSGEAVFVKNLENVQGDERDTIIFSIGYGKDSEGRLSMNFGPLNKEGGERRLNVAVTRAKRRLKVYSTMTSDEIDLRRTSATGVKHFRMFLDYAARGTLADSVSARENQLVLRGSSFESAVQSALESKGWKVDNRVGYAGYKIDLAVRDPSEEGKYLLGIECDGATYSEAKTARDRDRTRSAVLKGLGWKLHRVWSVQWHINKKLCIQQIESALNTDSVTHSEAKGAAGNSDASTDVSGPIPTADYELRTTGIQLIEYETARKPKGRSRDLDFSETSNKAVAVDWLLKIVRVEQPITLELAARRLSLWCGLQQLRGKFRQRFGEIVSAAQINDSVIVEEGVLWESVGFKEEQQFVRRPQLDVDGHRDLAEIPDWELSMAVLYVLQEQFGLPRMDLMREAGKLIGISRITSRVSEVFGPIIDDLISKHKAHESDGIVEPVNR